MLFNSLAFLLLFLPAVVGGAVLLRGRPLLVWLCAASVLFYGLAGHAWFLIPMAVTTTLDYWVGKRLERAEGGSKRGYLLLSLVGNLGLLAYFKYSGLLVDSAQSLAHLFGASSTSVWADAFRVALPAGISFYTFQTMSYVLDIYRGHSHAEDDFFAYLAFVAFFPHLVAGPLTRHDQLIPQLKRLARERVRPRWWMGASLFSIGLIKKVLVADRIAALIDPMIGNASALGITSAWLAVVGYAMQIYFDFSGYSDMAIGLGRLFDIDLPQNFDSPYKSLNPSDFWRRWHITLSQWLRDYLYISLGGNRCSPARVRFNLMMTMLLGGLWHGANWTFAIWGAYHGLLLVVYQGYSKTWDKMHVAVQRAVMFVLVCVGWVFFRAPTLRVAGSWLAAMAGLHGVGAHQSYQGRLFVFVAIATGIAMLLRNAYEIDLEAVPRYRRALLGAVTAIAVVMMNFSSKFLYFQF